MDANAKKMKHDVSELLKNLDSLAINFEVSMNSMFDKMGKKSKEEFLKAAKAANIDAALKQIEDAKKIIKNAKFD